MTPERWNKIEQLYHATLERDESQRAAYLHEVCAGDDSLRRDVESLLAQETRRNSFLESPAVEIAARAMAMDPGKSFIGQQLGVYQIVSLLGAGGMGEVYQAHDAKLARDVAIKVLPKAFVHDAERLARFQREARMLAALNHPNIATIYGLEQSDGIHFLVMELVPGETLAQKLTGGAFREGEAVAVGAQIAEALEEAHEHKLVHRDLKPANVMMTPKGRVKVLDFGVAKLLRSSEETISELTAAETKGVVGTLPYMAPEQLRGEEVDARTDLWALGAVLYEMTTGRRPFSEELSLPLINSILNQSLVVPSVLNPTVSSELERIIVKCLEKDRELRYQSAADLRADLKRVQRDSSASATVRVAPRHVTRLSARRQRAVLRAAILIVLMLVIGFAFAHFYPPSPEEFVVPPSKYVQVTDFTDSATAPSLSPDGRMITFVRGGGGGFPLSTGGQIYVKLLPNGESERLTNDDKAKYGPVFTPDGSRIAYTVPWDTWIIPVLGGQPTRLLPNASGLAWLDDHHVLFSEIKGTGFHMGIVTATEDRSEQHEIYFPGHERAMAHFSWASPERKWVVLAEMDRTARWQPCRLVPLDGSSVGRQIGPNGACTSAAWSRDGKWIYFSAIVDGASHLWRQRFPNGAPKQITFGPTEEEGVALAPDGKSAVTSVGIRESSLWLHDASGDRLISSEGNAFAPQLSMDGQRVYYLLQRSRIRSAVDLQVLHLDSGSTESVLRDVLVRLPDLSLHAADYEVSRDEHNVVFATKEDGKEPEIWLASLDRRSAPRLITRGGDEVSFGTDGDILFRSLEGNANFLSRIKEDGSGRERVSDTPILNKFSVSPDGKWTLASVPGSGELVKAETLAISTRRDPPQRLCSNYCPARWSANGRFLYLNADGMTTLVLPVSSDSSLPAIPRAGLAVLTPDGVGLPNALLIEHSGVVPGPDPSTYVFVKTDDRRNLFHIPLS